MRACCMVWAQNFDLSLRYAVLRPHFFLCLESHVDILYQSSTSQSC